MPPKGYRSVSIPAALLKEAEKLLKELEQEGIGPFYTNVTEFVKDAVRQRIFEFRRIYFLGENEAPQ